MYVSFFFNDTATTEIYTLSLHDALPISICGRRASSTNPTPNCAKRSRRVGLPPVRWTVDGFRGHWTGTRSEEHTSELQSRLHLVCRLLLEKKNIIQAMRPQSGFGRQNPH